MRVIGTCSICGGAVTVPALWGGILPPQPTCASCGSVAASHGPVIKMTSAPRHDTSNVLRERLAGRV